MGAISRLLLLFTTAICADSCTMKKPSEPSKKYSIMVMSDDDKQYIIQTDTLDHGTAYPVRDGVPVVSPPRIWYYMLVKDGYYYFVNNLNHYFVKNEIVGQQFVAIDSVLLPDFKYPDNCQFYSKDSIFIVNSGTPSGKKYARVNIHDMKAVIADLPVPAPQAPFKFLSVGFVEFRPPYCYIGYTYHYQDDAKGYGSSDTVYLAQTGYPDMQLQQVMKDARSTYPGNVNTAQQNTFHDENGDFYFLSCPGIVRGANPDQPTAIYRMKAGEQGLDSSYFFNISASAIHNHAYGLWYIGQHEAIVRSERKDLFATFEEHYKVPHIEYYVVNLQTQAVRKLDLPLDRGSSRTCVLAEGNNVYISINDGKGGNDIWIYNTKDAAIKKGLHIAGPVNYILRLEKTI